MSDTDLWNIDLLDTHLDLLDTDITSKHFVCLQDVLKTSSRYVLKTSSRHVFKTSSKHVLKTSWKRLQCNNFSSSKTTWRRLQNNLWEALKTSSRHLQDVFEDVKLLWWRRVEEVFKTSWRPTNVCWEVCFSKLSEVFFRRRLEYWLLLLRVYSFKIVKHPLLKPENQIVTLLWHHHT